VTLRRLPAEGGFLANVHATDHIGAYVVRLSMMPLSKLMHVNLSLVNLAIMPMMPLAKLMHVNPSVVHLPMMPFSMQMHANVRLALLLAMSFAPLRCFAMQARVWRNPLAHPLSQSPAASSQA
jgi:hypothetical protein